ncbi:MAG: hypothetical protein ABJP96_02775 [Erythrobacter sp.]
MQRGALDIGEQFAHLTCMLEDAHGIAVAGQAHDLACDEYRVLVQQLHRAIGQMLECANKIERSL